MQPAVTFRGIKKYFPGTKAVDFLEHEEINIYPGEIHGLIGENGAGKSTLLQILMGIYKRDGGDILLHGQPFEPKNALSTEKQGVSIIMQQPNILHNLTVAENIFIGRDKEFRSKAGLILWDKQNKAAMGVLEMLGFTDMKPTDVLSDLTFEKRKQVEIARALSINPKVLLVDETSAAVSRESVEKLYAILRRYRDKGVAIIYISHFIDEIYELCDRITVLRDGRLIDSMEVKDTTPDSIIAKMVGREVADDYRQDNSMDGIGKPVLETRSLTRKGDFADISIQIREGEIVGLGGIGGCGAEELGMALYGKLGCDAGDIVLEGNPLGHMSMSSSVKRSIGYVPKDRDKDGLIGKFPIDVNISSVNLGALQKAGFIDFGGEKQQAREAVKEFKIKAASITSTVSSLSGGNRQKVAMAKWVVNNARVLIINSPTRGVDVGAKFEIYRHIEALKRQKKAILLITDDLPELMGMSDRIYTMKQGKVTAHFSRDDGFTDEALMKFMT